MMRPQRTRVVGTVLVAAVSLFIGLLTTELVLRRLFPYDTGTSFRYRAPHPRLGWALEPGASYRPRSARGPHFRVVQLARMA